MSGRVTALLIGLALSLAACGTANPSPTPVTTPIANTPTHEPSPAASPERTASPAASPAPTPTPAEEFGGLTGLTFVREVDGLRQVFMVEVDGSLRQLTDLPPMEFDVGPHATMWSPDGRWLAIQLATQTDFTGLGILPADGGDPTIVNGYAYASWAPDSSRLLAGQTFHVMGPEGFNRLEVVVIDPASGEARRVALGGFPVWHPDGERITVYRNLGASGERDGTPQLVLIDLADGSEEELMLNASNVAWEPGGDRFAFVRRKGQAPGTEIWIGTEGGSAEYLTDGDYPQWSPDGRYLVYSADGPAGLVTRVMEMGDGHQVDLGIGVTPPIAWSSDGRRIAFETLEQGEPVIRVISLDTGELGRTRGIGPAWRPAEP